MSVYTLIDKVARASIDTLKNSLKGLAYKDKVSISDINASGTPSSSNYLAGDGSWKAVATGSGAVIDTSALTITWTDSQGNSVVGYITASE